MRVLHGQTPIAALQWRGLFRFRNALRFAQRLDLGILFMRLAVTPPTTTLRILILALAIGLSVGQGIGAAAPPVPPAPAQPAAAPAPRAAAPRATAAAPKLPDAPTVLMMVRSTLLALDQGIRTG